MIIYIFLEMQLRLINLKHYVQDDRPTEQILNPDLSDLEPIFLNFMLDSP